MNYVSQKKLCQGSFFQLFSLSHNTIESAETSQLLIQPNRVTGLKAEIKEAETSGWWSSRTE